MKHLCRKLAITQTPQHQQLILTLTATDVVVAETEDSIPDTETVTETIILTTNEPPETNNVKSEPPEINILEVFGTASEPSYNLNPVKYSFLRVTTRFL